MPYDDYLAQRIRDLLERKRIAYSEKRMMGGVAFMVDDKMLCGLLNGKEDGQPRLMARVGQAAAEQLLNDPQVLPWGFSKTRMKAYLEIGPTGMDADADLERWIDLCLAFNPEAKRSKRRGGKQ